MADVFISYAREDRESAKRLADAVESRGWTVWWDHRIPAGKSYEDVIEKAINDAGCVIVLWTGKSVASEWVRNEAAEAARRKVLIPIRLEDVRLPMSFRHLQADDLFAWTSAELENCLDSIQSMIGAPAKRASEPPAPVGVRISVPVEAPPLPVKDELPPVPDSVAPAAPLPATTPGFQPKVVVTITVGLVILIFLIWISSKKQENVTTDPAAVDPSSMTATDTSATTATETTATTSVSVFTTDTTSTTATSTGVAAVASEVVDLETNLGKITIELFPEAAPNHVNNFLKTARSGGFDGDSVYYVEANSFTAGHETKETVQQEPNEIAFVKGTVMGLAWPNGADSGGSFYVAVVDVLGANRKMNTVFGRVIAGMDIADKIAKMPANAEKHPLTPITITRAVVRKRDV